MEKSMDLKIKDVAELLNVSETTIRRWLIEKKIPAYRLNGQFRFNRTEIENWVVGCRTSKLVDEMSPFADEAHPIKLNSEKAKNIVGRQIGTQAFSLFRAIYKGGIIHDIDGRTKEEVISKSVKIIAENLNLDAEVLTELLLDRERLMPTALNHGVAVPHTRDFLLPKTYDIVSVVYLKKPIDYGSLDGKPVDVLFFLFACNDKNHLHLLAKLAHLTRDEESLSFLKTFPMKSTLLDFIKKWESNLNIIE
ncbi:MAG: PTS sugar transporter subunit IIA [Chlamydiae bacterium]|nr:PTS sugar transporter subunit IIA [Chlamydiota bacterium]